ncbi:MAG: cell division protein FtsA [Alphaproteobacteria bacterium]|nr:cell division protein FtsA [Alphaproteobacteria bacterium]
MLGNEKQNRPSGPLVGFLDIGSYKNSCLIVVPDRARHRSPLGATIVGASCMRSRGIKSGVVSNLAEAERAVKACVSEAELMAGDTLETINVAFSCGRLESDSFRANAEIPSGVVSRGDIARCHRAGRSFAVREGRRLVHMNEMNYRLDGQTSTLTPLGMAARHLTASLHTVTADPAPLHNLEMLAARCFLKIGRLIVAPFASAIAAASPEERQLGITVIDIGGGTVKIAQFADGCFANTSVMPVGADHITGDIARRLQTPFAEAERIKALYGTLVSAQSDSHMTFSYPLAGHEDDGMHHSNKAHLAEIVSHRTAMIASLIRERLDRSEVAELVGDKVVLTGGGSDLVGMAEFMANHLGRSVRVARPSAQFALPQNLSGPGFSTVVGMVAAGISPAGATMRVEHGEAPPQGYLGRVGQWLMTGL